MIEHGGDVTLTVTTPVGTSFRSATKFIGAHSDHRILLEIPNIDESDLKYFFQEGFWLIVSCYLSARRRWGGSIPFSTATYS